MEYESNKLAQFFSKNGFSINFVTGVILGFCYLVMLDVARLEVFSSYYLNLSLSTFLYSILHVLVYLRIYLFLSKRYEKKAKDSAHLHTWVYAIVFSLGIVGFAKFSSGI